LEQRTFQALAKHKRSHFHFSFIRDEWCMFYSYNLRTM
jgi:hypothetical protein